MDCLRTSVICEVSATGEDGQRKTRPDRPGATVPAKESLDISADVTPRTGESEDREKGGFGDADLRVGRSKLAFGLGNIRPALEQRCGQTGGNLRWVWVPIRVGRLEGRKFENRWI